MLLVLTSPPNITFGILLSTFHILALSSAIPGGLGQPVCSMTSPASVSFVNMVIIIVIV